MFTRRHLIKAAGAGLALTGSGLELGSARAAGAAIDLPAALPEGARNNAMLDSLPGKKPRSFVPCGTAFVSACSEPLVVVTFELVEAVSCSSSEHPGG